MKKSRETVPVVIKAGRADAYPAYLVDGEAYVGLK